jgi:hypothetical protein
VPFEVHIVSVSAPTKIMTSQAFAITAETQYSLAPNRTVAVVTLDRDTSSIVSASERRVSGDGEAQLVNIILSGERARPAHLSLVPLVSTDDEWSVVANGAKDVLVQVTDSFSVTVMVRYADIAVQFDGQTFRTGANGDVSINSTRGEHLISTPLTITFDNKSRAIFRQWNTTASSSNLPLSISSDVCLLAVYQTQYYLDVTSPLGEASGSGWYDEGSIAHIQVEPVLVSQGKTYVFAGWAGDSSDSAPASSILMNSPKNAQVSWRELTPGERNMNLLPLYGLFATSLAILLGSLLFACMSLRRVPTARGADISDTRLGYS